MQLGPDSRTGTEHEQPHRFPAVAQCQNEQPRAPVLAGVGIADHRSSPVIDLALLTCLGPDDNTRFGSSVATQLAHIAFHALISAPEPVHVDQVLPDAHGVSAASQFQLDQFPVGLAGAQ